MIGDLNINWIGTSINNYVSLKLEEGNTLSFYFTKGFLSNLKKRYQDFFDKDDNKYHLMIGFDKEKELLLFGICKKSNQYSSNFSLTLDKNNNFKGKPKNITDENLKSFIKSKTREDSSKLVDYDLELKNDKIVIKFYLDNIVY